jgi:hypothetical protein
MKKPSHQDVQAPQVLPPSRQARLQALLFTGAALGTTSRRARLQALLFTGAALGTTLLTVIAADPKLPPFKGE